MLLSVERPFVGALAVHIPGATLPHCMVWCEQSRRRRLNMANEQLGFPRNLRDPVDPSVQSRQEIPGYQLQAVAVHSSAKERKQRVIAEVPPSEGNEVRWNGRQEVIAS